MQQTLVGQCIAVPETRQLDVLSGLLQRRGADVWRCPLVGIHNTPDTAAVLQWLQHFNNGEVDELVLLTGEGLRRLLDIIRTHAAAEETLFLQRLAAMRIIVRGPKPAKVLKELGITNYITAASPTSAGVIETLAALDLSGHTVAVQLYGTEPNLPLVHAIEAAGAQVLAVAPYIYADEADEDKVQALVQVLINGKVQAITFTSQPQIRRLLAVAKKQSCEAELVAALNKSVVAAVGPVMAEALQARGIVVKVAPESSFFMKPLVTSLVAHLQQAGD